MSKIGRVGMRILIEHLEAPIYVSMPHSALYTLKFTSHDRLPNIQIIPT